MIPPPDSIQPSVELAQSADVPTAHEAGGGMKKFFCYLMVLLIGLQPVTSVVWAESGEGEGTALEELVTLDVEDAPSILEEEP